jgi:hypothetical protein
MSDHRGQENVLVRPQGWYADALPLQIGNTPDAVVAKQFETDDMHAGQERDRLTGGDRYDQRATKFPLKSTVPCAMACGLGVLCPKST